MPLKDQGISTAPADFPPVTIAAEIGLPQSAALAPRIDGYTITGRLGEGGMGTVWRAVQLSTRREVALKVMGAAWFGSEAGRVRFDREVELTARLEHPNLARLYESGLHQGVCFYAMELVDGSPITSYCDAHRLTTTGRLELFLQLCQAVQHAHQKGVIHRDLKPSNVLVSTTEGRPVAGNAERGKQSGHGL